MAAAWGSFFGTTATGAVAGAASGAIMTGSLEGTLKGAIWGAISAGVSYGIGHGISYAKGTNGGLAKHLLHGLSRGAISKAQGGTFKAGFMSGYAASAFNPGTTLGDETLGESGGFALRTFYGRCSWWNC